MINTLKRILNARIRFTYVGSRTKNVFRWKPFVKLREWMDDNIILTMSAKNGKFQSDFMPHAIGIFEDIDKTGVRKITLKSSSQVIKTTIGIGFILKYIDTDASNSMIMIPKAEGRTNYSANILKPKIEGCPSVKQKMMEYKVAEKNRDNSFLYKFAGGLLNLKGSNDTKSISVKYALFDEVADFKSGKVAEALERMKTFLEVGGKALIVSTQEHENDEINFYYNTSEVKKMYHMNCIHCNEYYYPEIEHLIYPSQKEYMSAHGITEELEVHEIIGDYLPYARERVVLKCPKCEKTINNSQRKKTILDGKCKWFQMKAEKTEDGIKYTIADKIKERYETVGFDINTLCVNNVPMSELVNEIVNASVSPDEEVKLDMFYKGYLNRIYKKVKQQADQNDMLLLGNNVPEWKVPKDTAKIYLTIDNQLDYLFAQVTAIGYGVEPHIMYFGRIESWSAAEEMWELCQYLEDENGETYMASKMMIDRRGYNIGQISRTEECDTFVNYMTQKWGEDRIYAGEGHAELTGGKSFTVGNHKDYSKQRNELKIKVIKFSNIYIKNQLFRMIDRTIMKQKAETEEDEGFNYKGKMLYINQDNIERDMEHTDNLSLTKMLTAEVYDYAKNPNTGKLANEKSWIPIRKRNDAIDTTSMALALAEMDKIILMRRPSNENLEAVMESMASLDMG